MIASLGRYLHQQIDAVEAWDYADFLAYREAAVGMMEREHGEN